MWLLLPEGFRQVSKPSQLVCLAAAALLPTASHGSFGGGGCNDFVCQFLTIGFIVGTVGVPISGLIFAVLRAFFCHPDRKKLTEFFLGALFGAIAFEICAALAALVGTSGMVPAGHEKDFVGMVFLSTFVVLAIVSVLHARTSPPEARQHS